jgi:CheY-like chemotaxis protein
MKTTANDLVQSVKRWAADGPPTTPDRTTTILVVDDEEPLLRYVNRVLTGAGYRTTLATSGPAAIEAAARERFDLLVTDVSMPEMSGAQLVLRLRQDDPDLKVLYLTGCTDQLFEEKATLRHEEAFLEKPCSAIELLQAVELAITGRVTRAI